jgi:hypothetical protein
MSKSNTNQGSPSSTPVGVLKITTEDILALPSLRYKPIVLLFDLRNVAKNHDSELCILLTTDPLYINKPYFTPKGAGFVKKAR